MSTMYPHTITCWYRDGETNRQTSWARSVMPNCRWQGGIGADRGLNGDTQKGSIKVILDQQAWPGISIGDYVSLGIFDSDKPTSNAAQVSVCKPVLLGAFVHHWEIEAS